MAETNARAIYYKDDLVRDIIERADIMIDNCENGAQVYKEGCLDMTLVKKLRDILGLIWTRPFTILEDRDALSPMVDDLVRNKIITRYGFLDDVRKERLGLEEIHGKGKREINMINEMAIENVLLKTLVTTLERLI